MIKPIPTEILKRAIEGDRRAFQKIVEGHLSFAYAVAYRMLGNRADAEDITQDAFFRLWKNIPKYKVEIKLSTWLYKIVTNLCLDFLKSTRYRERKFMHDVEAANSVQSSLTPEDIMNGEELQNQLLQASEVLSPLQKAVFILRDLEALTVEETCEILSIDADGVKSNLFHARKKISATLKLIYETHEPK
ncbi:RNA polymerase sigma factor [Pseudochryseolinea flava]|uniref:RNA polymerase subunit sigma-70 n=1 Tax=Pseudochryseolinea flava TaxID=2059302 RepID=A0A364Y2C8_9BACT|nr:RNA polymerase sigma factor [Pseudochryseolinea flava]RAW00832.1 hypothetical protein DQQ10_11330 [Pseudochryseolinea flava]